jgi:hypothetical protein
MNVINSQLHPEATGLSDPPAGSSVTKLTGEVLPACWLFGIMTGFAAFVAFRQAILPAVFAAIIGALLGVFFACDEEPAPVDETHTIK